MKLSLHPNIFGWILLALQSISILISLFLIGKPAKNYSATTIIVGIIMLILIVLALHN